MKITTLEDLYIEQLKDLYSAEKQLAEGLGRLGARAQADDLRSLLQKQIEASGQQREKLETLFEHTSHRPTGEKCEAMEGLVKEIEKLTGMCETPEARDAALIAGLQRIKHYEIAGYGCARAYARTLGDTQATDRLAEILEEEASGDEALSRLATGSINELATEAVPA